MIATARERGSPHRPRGDRGDPPEHGLGHARRPRQAAFAARTGRRGGILESREMTSTDFADAADLKIKSYLRKYCAICGLSLAGERALGARHAGHARVGFDGHAQRAGGRFEDRFADVVAVAAVVQRRRAGCTARWPPTACQKSSTSSLSKSPILAVGNATLNTKKYRPLRSIAVVTSVSSIGSVKWP